eukprot:1036210-Pleurochrysis_carterae.AAC.1
MEGSTRGGEVCGLLTRMLVVRGPWRRELFRRLRVWTVWRDDVASERAGSRSSESGERQRGSRAPLRSACIDAGA